MDLHIPLQHMHGVRYRHIVTTQTGIKNARCGALDRLAIHVFKNLEHRKYKAIISIVKVFSLKMLFFLYFSTSYHVCKDAFRCTSSSVQRAKEGQYCGYWPRTSIGSWHNSNLHLQQSKKQWCIPVLQKSFQS